MANFAASVWRPLLAFCCEALAFLALWRGLRRRRSSAHAESGRLQPSSADGLARRALAGEMAVRLPPAYLKPPPRELGRVPVGETVYVSLAYVAVDPEGFVFLKSAAEIVEKPLQWHVKVRVEEHGCTLFLQPRRKPTFLFQAEPLSRFIQYLPVIRIIEEDDASAS